MKQVFLLSLCLLSSSQFLLGQTSQDVLVFDTFAEMESKLYTDSDTTYVMNFWATWCKPCVAELPYFEELNQASDLGETIKVVLVSLDDKKFLDRKVKTLLQKKNIQSEVWLLDDPKYNDWIDKISTEWSGAIPATLLFSKSKRHFEEADFASYAELKQFIQQFLES